MRDGGGQELLHVCGKLQVGSGIQVGSAAATLLFRSRSSWVDAAEGTRATQQVSGCCEDLRSNAATKSSKQKPATRGQLPARPHQDGLG